jgi:MFS family permease
MPVEPRDKRSSEFAFRPVGRFLRLNWFAVVLVSALLLVQCFWHSRIQAGDLGSHVYNAWLAQLIEHHQISGLMIARQGSNVLFDLLLLHTANLAGFVAAEKIVVGLAVLVFFWGSFSFLAAASGRPPWLLMPFLFILSYGYVFHMGFMNYYLSIGLALVALALSWRGEAGNWLAAVALSAVSFLAHPLGFLLAATVSAYIWIWRILPRWWRLAVPALALTGLVALRFFFASHQAFEADWRATGFLQLLGQDQLNLFGRRYEILSWVALAWGTVCALAAIYDWSFREKVPSATLRLALELYLVAVVATFCLPENFRTNIYAGWIGLLVSRLTLVTAIFGLLVLASLRLPRWSAYGASLLGAVFFLFLYQDTGKLDRMEANARVVVQQLPVGTRIVAVASPPGDWRIEFIHHSIERACIGRCFSFANYEPSSLQFRIRALPGGFFVTDSADKSEAMSSGDYLVQKDDLPLTSIYQCDDADFTRLCAHALREGQKAEDPEDDPFPDPASDSSPKAVSQPQN